MVGVGMEGVCVCVCVWVGGWGCVCGCVCVCVCVHALVVVVVVRGQQVIQRVPNRRSMSQLLGIVGASVKR